MDKDKMYGWLTEVADEKSYKGRNEFGKKEVVVEIARKDKMYDVLTSGGNPEQNGTARKYNKGNIERSDINHNERGWGKYEVSKRGE